MTQANKLIIIGSGPAGYTAALYAARANLSPILIAGNQPGGQLMVTTDVENFPGFRDIIQGPWLMEEMRAQVEKLGTIIISDHIEAISPEAGHFVCKGEKEQYLAQTIIIATGAQARWLNLPSETKYRGYGVSGCATCDAPFYRNQDVAVIGGGNTAVEEALHLTQFARKVYLIHRRNKLTAENMLQQRLFSNKKVEVIWDHNLVEVLGTENPLQVTGAKLAANTKEERILNVTGIFIAIGHTPNTKMLQGLLQMDQDGYIITVPESTLTNVPGIFAAGDVKDKVYRQAVTAAGSGCMAALDATRFLETRD